jgi:hypothetical protein
MTHVVLYKNSAGCSYLMSGGLSCSLDVLHEGIGINKYIAFFEIK